MATVTGWLLAPAPLARIAVLRAIAYLFVPVDILLTTPWVDEHAQVPGDLYQPLLLGRLLPLPTPGPWVEFLQWVLIAAALVAATGRVLPRALGTVVALLYLQWMVVAFSYGKVDHDRIGYLVLLFALATVGTAGFRDRRATEAAGWVISVVTLAVVATYFLSAFAKLRFGGLDWAGGATLTRAVVRKGTSLSTPLLDSAWVLHTFQYVLLCVELFVAPLLLVRHRHRWVLVASFYVFHVMTFLMLRIIFLPHCIAMLALLPVERLVRTREGACA